MQISGADRDRRLQRAARLLAVRVPEPAVARASSLLRSIHARKLYLPSLFRVFDEADWMQERASNASEASETSDSLDPSDPSEAFPQQRVAQLHREVPAFQPESGVAGTARLRFQHTLRNGVVIGAVENRYDHFVGDGKANEGQIKFEDVVQLGRKHNLTVGKCSFEVFDAFVDMFEKNGIIARRVERTEGVMGSDERVPERVLVRAHAGKLPRAGVELAVQPKMAVGLHARQGVPEMGRELPRGERVVGILMSFMGCLLNERTVCEWKFLGEGLMRVVRMLRCFICQNWLELYSTYRKHRFLPSIVYKHSPLQCETSSSISIKDTHFTPRSLEQSFHCILSPELYIFPIIDFQSLTFIPLDTISRFSELHYSSTLCSLTKGNFTSFVGVEYCLGNGK